MKKLMIAAMMVFATTAMFAQEKAKDAEKRTPAERIDKQVEKMKTELSLTDEQTQKVKMALYKRAEVVTTNKKAKEQAVANIKSANKEFMGEMEKTLKPEQLAKFNEMKEEKENKKEAEMND